jgi:hypothetical protein
LFENILMLLIDPQNYCSIFDPNKLTAGLALCDKGRTLYAFDCNLLSACSRVCGFSIAQG